MSHDEDSQTLDTISDLLGYVEQVESMVDWIDDQTECMRVLGSSDTSIIAVRTSMKEVVYWLVEIAMETRMVAEHEERVA